MGFRGEASAQFMASCSGLYYGWLVFMTMLLQATTRKTRILDVVYNSSNNELVSDLLLLYLRRKPMRAFPFALFEEQASMSSFTC